MLCDLIARTAFAPTELNISTVTSVFGAPVVIYMMLKRRKGRTEMNVDTPYFVTRRSSRSATTSVPVIRDISVKVQKGEIIALIGPNGAGKSTLLKTIARDLEPIPGKIVLEGRDMQTITYRELSKKLAVILTERIKVELTTCRDVVATGRYPVHRTARRAPR